MPKSHGMSGTPEYIVYRSMLQRCHDVNYRQYHHYGGRGIFVCDRWMESFENFIEDVGMRPSPDHWLERKDNDKGYAPENVAWVHKDKQLRNRRKFKNNKSGKTGVFRVTINGYAYWQAFWRCVVNDKQRTKYFSISKLGEDEAFRLASEHREAMIALMNMQGAGYSESHGA